MKLNQIIIVLFSAIFMSINTYGQENFLYLRNEFDSINSLKGKIILISILDTENTNEIKELDLLAEKYKSNNVTFIAITDQINENRINSLKNEFPHFIYLSKDENDKVFNTYQTSMYKVFPIQILINTKGDVKYKKKGKMNNIEEKLSKRIDRILSKNLNISKFKEDYYSVE